MSGVIAAGAFVRFAGDMSDAYEGFLPVRKIVDDHYDLNATESALIGRRTGRRLGFGDPVSVHVEALEAPRGRVDLVPAEQAPARPGAAQRRRGRRRSARPRGSR